LFSPWKKEKLKKPDSYRVTATAESFEELDVLSGGLEASPGARKPVIEP
jgi:hypothetical protein